ncbi:hypothetical protein LWC35_19130 [Pseudonocardia kujensis]|uniref:hypothetical protein n=1 Tax=Pseudonocardia kujensis TaxID=1128675 RepID=UPI001E4A2B65|nr:hypothetical protein [Pseudonocardia kujensis]MCE0764997.1 hypothetical protein [Pseudonocardia kujensis]
MQLLNAVQQHYRRLSAARASGRGRVLRRRVGALIVALGTVVGLMVVAGPAYADSRGCNGEICLQLWGSVGPDPITARITYTGGNQLAKSYGLVTQHNGVFWVGSPTNSATFSNMRIAQGQVCATIRWAGSQNGPPGYPCLQLR